MLRALTALIEIDKTKSILDQRELRSIGRSLLTSEVYAKAIEQLTAPDVEVRMSKQYPDRPALRQYCTRPYAVRTRCARVLAAAACQTTLLNSSIFFCRGASRTRGWQYFTKQRGLSNSQQGGTNRRLAVTQVRAGVAQSSHGCDISWDMTCHLFVHKSAAMSNTASVNDVRVDIFQSS